MKSSLRFALLFALIIIGKFTRQSATVRDAVKLLNRNNSLSVPATSFFTRQTSLPVIPVGSDKLWRTTGSIDQQIRFE